MAKTKVTWDPEDLTALDLLAMKAGYDPSSPSDHYEGGFLFAQDLAAVIAQDPTAQSLCAKWARRLRKRNEAIEAADAEARRARFAALSPEEQAHELTRREQAAEALAKFAASYIEACEQRLGLQIEKG